jgi:hypothetical protein
MKRTLAAAVLLLSAASGLRAEVKYAPYLNVEFYGGQSVFSGNDDSPVSSLNGNGVFVPALRFGDKFSLLPTVALGYRRSRDVQELAGGGFLTQQQQTRSGSLKGIYAFDGGWKGKASLGYRQELVKETADEGWGDGLFDYDKTSVGVEAEREGSTLKSLRFGLDYYTTAFPNFQSLSSQSNFGAEINTGADVLDFDATDVSVGSDLAVGEKGMLSNYLLYSSRDFTDQNIVKKDGTYEGSTRKDSFLYVSGGYSRQLPGFSLFGLGVESLAGLDLSYGSLDSDQNNYDASRTKFNENYYDYGELSVGPRVAMRFREKLTLGLGYTFAKRDYADRPVQNADGTYTTDTISNDVTTFRWSLGYPLLKGLGLKAQGAFQNSDSNMEYETVYRYDYSSSHYFLGLTYQL